MRGNKIASLQSACLSSLGTCAEGVQFYCSSHTYAAIPFCNIFPFLEHSNVAEWRGPISHFKTWFWLNDFELKSAAVCAHYFDCSNFKIILFYISACCSLHSERNLFQKWQNVCNTFWSKRVKKRSLKRSINFYFWGTYSIE